MVDVISIEREHAQEVAVTSEVGGDNSSETQRKKSVSGPGSEGEKSLLKKNPGWLVSPKVNIPVFNSCLCSLDEVVATPAANVKVIDEACNSQTKNFNFFNDVINSSKYVAYIDSALAGLGLFAVSIGIYVIKYCKLREIERNSNYFYFSRLVKMAGNKSSTDDPNGYLQAAAYFYPPDISKIACWRRRFFAVGKKREQLNELNKFLEKNSKENALDKLHGDITEKVCQLLNKEAQLDNFRVKKSESTWTVGLADNYAKKFFYYVRHLIEENAKTTKENNDKRNKNYVLPIVSTLGQASFIYWILMFIFYFIPIAPVVTTAAISVIPLAIVLCAAFPLLLYFEIKSARQIYKSKKNMTKEDIKTQHKQMIENKLVALNKQKVFLNCFIHQKANSTIELKNSPLMKDLTRVLKRRRFSKYHAICMGFLDGCFLPLFAGWLFLDGTKVILTYALCSTTTLTTFTPIGFVATAIIAGITLLMGISYGIYSACKANQVHKAKFDDLQIKIKALQDEVPTKQVLNKSLRDYDRILRRFSDERPLWTDLKRVFSRFIIIIKRLGTGSLVFRLVIWSPITAIYAAVVASFAVPAFFPILLIIGTTIGAFVLASCYLYAYNLESKTTQAGRIVEHLVQSEQLAWIDEQLPALPLPEEPLNLHTLVPSESSIVASEKIISPKKDTPTEPLHENVASVAESSHSTERGTMTAQKDTGTQSHAGHSSLPGGLFKDIQAMEENSAKNMGDSLSTPAFSC